MAVGIRRIGAIAGTAALAGTMLLGAGAGAANAATDGRGSQGETKFVRVLDKNSVTVGDNVTVTTTLSKDGGVLPWLIYWMKDLHPTCFEYVPNSLEWTASNSTYTQATNPDEVTVSSGALEVNPPIANSWARPVVMKSTYKVTCDAGSVNSGGLEWDTTNAISGHGTFASAGPMLTVTKAPSSVTLGSIGTAQTGVSKPLNITTANVPNGSSVDVYDGTTKLGSAPVSNNQATYQWTPTTSGSHTIKVAWAGDAKFAASESQTQTVNVQQSLQASTTTLDAIASAKVGAQTLLTAHVDPSADGSTVTFKVNNEIVGVGTVSGGVATYGWNPTAAGTANVTAEYSGGGTIAPSVSGAQSVAVGEADPNITSTTTTVNLPATATANSAVTLGATVDHATQGTAVTFKAGAQVIGQGTVGADGKVSIQWTPTVVGPVNITAEYAGDATTSASSGSATLTVASESTDPGDPTDPTDPSTPGTGSLGSLSSITGSLTGSLGN